MKATKKETANLTEIYNKLVKKDPKAFEFWSVEGFIESCFDLIEDIKNRKIILHVDVSQSGMTRKMNFKSHNFIINCLYNNNATWDPVRVGGCGMDMIWHTLFTCTQIIFNGNDKKIDKMGLNGKCSGYNTL